MGKRLGALLRSVLVVAGGIATLETAWAAPLSAEQATELLVRSQSANIKCGILEAQDSSDLDRLVEMAGKSLQAKQDTAVADRAMAKGRKIGSAVSCDSTTDQAVRGVLRAAREASAAILPVQDASPQPALRGTVQENQEVLAAAAVKPQQESADDAVAEISRNIETDITGSAPVPGEDTAIETVSSNEPPAKKKALVQTRKNAESIVKKSPKPTVSNGTDKVPKLQSYAQLAQFYYLQRRCRTMSRNSIASLYGKVVANHRITIRSHGAAEVAKVLRRAESRANKSRCS